MLDATGSWIESKNIPSQLGQDPPESGQVRVQDGDITVDIDPSAEYTPMPFQSTFDYGQCRTCHILRVSSSRLGQSYAKCCGYEHNGSRNFRDHERNTEFDAYTHTSP